MKIKSLVVMSMTLFYTISPVIAKEIKQLTTEKEKVSYSIGLSLGNNFKQQGLDINVDTLVKGVGDGLNGTQPLLTQEEIREVMTNLQKRMMAKKQKVDDALSGKNMEAGVAFLKKNKKEKGVVTLPSGLQYQIIRKGKGAIPKATDTVVTNYEGTLIDGTVFDSSYKRGKPATFPVNGVIKGWTEALQLMKTGAKWKLFIPSELAYGSRSAGQVIGPNSTLVFDIELLEIK